MNLRPSGYECCSYQNLHLHILSETPILRAFLIISVYILVYENISFDGNNGNITEMKIVFLLIASYYLLGKLK